MIESPFIKVAGFRRATLLQRNSNTGVFLWNSEIFKNLYFAEHLRTAASDGSDKVMKVKMMYRKYRNSIET